MLCLSDLKQFSELLSEYQKTYPKAQTNFLMMPGEITELCNSKMFFVSQSDGLFKILCDRGDYYNFYYYAAKDKENFDFSDIITFAKGKDILIDVVISERRNMQVGSFIDNMVLNKNIAEYKTYQRMNFNMEKADEIKAYSLPEDGYKEDEAVRSEDIISLWKTALDERSTPLPNDAEVEEIKKSGNIIAVSKDEDLSAVGILAVNARQAIIQHVAVSPMHRRKGLARYVLHKLILMASLNNIRVLRLWVDKNNFPAVTLYNREGFSPDGIVCKQYIFNN